MVTNRAEKLTPNETTIGENTVAQKFHRKPAITSTKPKVRANAEFADGPGALPGVYGTIIG
jgi:hypothetical protein